MSIVWPPGKRQIPESGLVIVWASAERTVRLTVLRRKALNQGDPKGQERMWGARTHPLRAISTSQVASATP